MDARARVLRVLDGRATLACEESHGCGDCGSSHGCGLRWIGGARRRTLDVPAGGVATGPLTTGEWVTVTVADADLLRIAAMLYLPPLGGLLAGALLARYLVHGGDVASAAAACCGLLAGWLVARAWARDARPGVQVSRADDAGPAA